MTTALDHSLSTLLTHVGDLYQIPPYVLAKARQLDEAALKYISSVVGADPWLIEPIDAYEIMKWGCLCDLSRYPEIRNLKESDEQDTTYPRPGI